MNASNGFLMIKIARSYLLRFCLKWLNTKFQFGNQINIADQLTLLHSNKSEVTTELCSYQQLTCLVWPENYGGSHFVFAQFKGRNWKAQHFNKEIFSDFQT